MTIKTEKHGYSLTCDTCDQEADCEFLDFEEALDYIKRNKWLTERQSKPFVKFNHKCDECLAKENTVLAQ